MEEMPPWLSPPPPPSFAERLLSLLKRHGFALVCLGLIALFGGLLLSMNRPASPRQEVDVEQLVAHAETERAERLAAAAQAAIYSTPPTLWVLSYPEGATVFLDRDSVGTTPLRAYPVSSGAHVVSVVRDSLAAPDTTVVLENGHGATLSFVLRPPSGTPEVSLAGADGTGSGKARAPERDAAPEADREEAAGFVRVSTARVVEAPSEPPLAASEPERAPARGADAEPARAAEPDPDRVRWLETEAERQQRLTSYVHDLIERRKQDGQAAPSPSQANKRPPLDSSELPLEQQQEQAREVIRKHEGPDSTRTTEQRKKRRGWW